MFPQPPPQANRLVPNPVKGDKMFLIGYWGKLTRVPRKLIYRRQIHEVIQSHFLLNKILTVVLLHLFSNALSRLLSQYIFGIKYSRLDGCTAHIWNIFICTRYHNPIQHLLGSFQSFKLVVFRSLGTTALLASLLCCFLLL